MNQWGQQKIIFMSATILDTAGFCKALQLPKDKTGIIKMDHVFDPEKSPIIHYPTGNMSYQYLDSTMPKIVNNIREILAMHPDEKGIIHTGNYKIAKAICESIDNPRLIMKEEDGSNEKLLKRHSKSSEATVLVSPSLTTGADLKDDLSRWQVIVKLPWPSLQDKRVQKKIEIDNDWYVAEMFRAFVQACGRSTRSENDWSTTYVLDTSFYSWIYKYKHWFSKKFLQRIIWKKEEYIKRKKSN
jgi:Rad3-related DNA helicase